MFRSSSSSSSLIVIEQPEAKTDYEDEDDDVAPDDSEKAEDWPVIIGELRLLDAALGLCIFPNFSLAPHRRFC
jgi:hypothetical protein